MAWSSVSPETSFKIWRSHGAIYTLPEHLMHVVPGYMEMPGSEKRMIRCCETKDFELIYDIINDGAHAYEGIIPKDRWREPYMSKNELQHEIDDGVAFWGYEES